MEPFLTGETVRGEMEERSDAPASRGPSLAGALLGGALGDALGLPYEGLAPERVAALWPPGPPRFRLPGGGWISDDTEHAFFTGLALLGSRGDPAAFPGALQRQFRAWFLALPPSLGLATGRAGLWTLLGLGPERTGVFSAGNGPLMRAPLLGAWASFHDLPDTAREALVDASTRLTHTDPIVVRSARALARLAACPPASAPEILEHILAELPPGPTRDFLELARQAHGEGWSSAEYLERSGSPRGISGFAPHSLGAAVHAALTSPGDPLGAAVSAIERGGDTDSVAALAGGLAGAWYGPGSLPEPLLAGLGGPLLGTQQLRDLASRLEACRPGDSRPRDGTDPALPSWPLGLGRNLGLLALCLLSLPVRWLGGRLGRRGPAREDCD